MRDFITYITVIYRWLKRNITDKVISRSRHLLIQLLHTGYRLTNTTLPIIMLVAFALIVYDFGFFKFYSSDSNIYRFLLPLLTAAKLLLMVRFAGGFVKIKKWRAHVYSFTLIILTLYLIGTATEVEALHGIHTTDYLIKKLLVYGIIIFLFVTEASGLLKFIYQRRQNTAFVFILSFAVIIAVGAVLLMLPTATAHGISVTDAFFTSASAVCVTGLAVVDTSADFTPVGQIILLLLIQVGGLGIMTFTGLLAYLAAGSVSFHNQVALKSMVSSNRISNVITIVGRIIVVTLVFEMIGAALIYISMDKSFFNRQVEHIFFSVFHAVSAFCNAGFSTLPDGINAPSVKFNYPFHLVLALMIVLGGMGFPIVFNIFSYVRRKVSIVTNRLLGTQVHEHETRVLQVNSKIALWTSFILIIIGTVLYFIFEYQATLREHPTFLGKLVTSLFGAIVPRSAGFNTVTMQALTLPTVMIYLLLMWIGASPSSTGGGIKTTTFALAFLNLRALITGNNRVEVLRTQISNVSINRAFAIIVLSLIVIGSSILLVSVTDSNFGLLQIAFESFSAFGTVGLTLGITPELSTSGKIILMITMFIGRVGSLTLLMAFATQPKNQLHQYPVEEISY